MIHRNNIGFSEAYRLIKSHVDAVLTKGNWDRDSLVIQEVATAISTGWLTIEQGKKRAGFKLGLDLPVCEAHKVRGCSNPFCH